MSSYQEAIGLIAILQREGTHWASSTESPFGPAFNTEILSRELEFFVDHFLVGYRKCLLTKAGRASLMAAFRDLAQELASEPQVLCHRDYHYRNLMVSPSHLRTISMSRAFQLATAPPDFGRRQMMQLLLINFVLLALFSWEN